MSSNIPCLGDSSSSDICHCHNVVQHVLWLCWSHTTIVIANLYHLLQSFHAKTIEDTLVPSMHPSFTSVVHPNQHAFHFEHRVCKDVRVDMSQWAITHCIPWGQRFRRCFSPSIFLIFRFSSGSRPPGVMKMTNTPNTMHIVAQSASEIGLSHSPWPNACKVPPSKELTSFVVSPLLCHSAKDIKLHDASTRKICLANLCSFEVWAAWPLSITTSLTILTCCFRSSFVCILAYSVSPTLSPSAEKPDMYKRKYRSLLSRPSQRKEIMCYLTLVHLSSCAASLLRVST